LKKEFSVSVRELAAFFGRAGDLGSARISRALAQEGLRVQNQLQANKPNGYRKEVTVRHTIERPRLILQINGRMDGLLEQDGQVIVEEIKATRHAFGIVHPERMAHWAQARIYAALYARQNDLASVTVHLIYYYLGSDQVEVLEEVRSIDELTAAFEEMTNLYLDWLEMLTDWQETRDASVANLAFPFALRAGQSELMEACRQTVERRQRLFLEAPTGIGKSLGVLFPAIQALGAGQVDRIFYLTAKNSGKASAELALHQLTEQGARVKRVTLTAKDKVCNRMGTPCDPSRCPCALGYYERVQSAVEAAFARRDDWDPEAIELLATEFQVCPYAFALELASSADVVICDYNYLFDPGAYLRGHFDDSSDAYLFLIDEAHNLAARAREMFSATLTTYDCKAFKQAVQASVPALARLAGRLIRCLDTLKAEREGDQVLLQELPEELVQAVQQGCRQMETWLASETVAECRGEVLTFYFELGMFLFVVDRLDDRYRIILDRKRLPRLQLFCLDPGKDIAASLDKGRATIFFSGTLSPVAYYRSLYGGDALDPVLVLDSPFDPAQLDIQVNTRIPTTYREREHAYAPIAASIRAFVDGRSGNVLVFFPSFAFLDRVAEHFHFEQDFGRLKLQRPRMSEVERTEYLERFVRPAVDGFMGFAVMGGIFGEGIDLVGESLSGAIIVGVGLPQVNPEQELIRAYYNEHGVDGFDYAYTYPGFSRVLQAAGRVIRSESDEGRLLLIDRRYAKSSYQELFPSWWQFAEVDG
jgi:DNA excision repair protein ERCC-2